LMGRGTYSKVGSLFGLLATIVLLASPTDALVAEGPSTGPEPATQPTTATTPAETMPTATTRPSPDDAGASAPVVPAPERPASMGPIRMNFQNAPLEAVLDYLSEAAGLVIVDPPDMDGRITVISRQPVTTDEAVALLDTVLRENGYASVYVGRTLRIVTLAEAKTSNIPVRAGNDPGDIEPSDRIITQIVPIRYVKAVDLRNDLANLFPESADVAANEASNSLIITDSQAVIRRIVEIIRALDQHMAGVSEVRVFQLTYADAANTAKLITELFQQEDRATRDRPTGFAARMQMMMRGRRDRGGDQQQEQGAVVSQRVVASADQRTNTLVVSAPPELITVIESVVKELDSNPAQEQTVFVYYLQNAQAESVAEALNDIFDEDSQAGSRTAGTTRGRTQGQQGRFTRMFGMTSQTTDAQSTGLVGDVYVVADEDTNSLLVRTSSQNIDRVKEILAELDRPIRQVLIKVLIAEVTHDDSLDVGTQWSALNLQFGTTGEFTVDFGAAEESGGFVTTTLDAGLSATFNALEREGRLDVLSRPYILASDNQEASIIVGEEVPYITNTRITETGQTLNTVEYEDVGIILNVTPHVNPEGLVIMDVAPEISNISDTTVPISETVDATVFNKRSAETRVAVTNGQTIVIGGLMEDRIVDTVRKVPVLGDIPGLGLLFKRTVQTKQKVELLIFLTPHVASRPEELKQISDAERAGIESVKEAVEGGAFDRQMKAMERSAAPSPSGESNETPR